MILDVVEKYVMKWRFGEKSKTIMMGRKCSGGEVWKINGEVGIWLNKVMRRYVPLSLKKMNTFD